MQGVGVAETGLWAAKIKVLRQLGTPYEEGYEQIANEDLAAQAQRIAKNLKAEGVEQEGIERKEIVAIIAYLQRLGVDATAQPQAQK